MEFSNLLISMAAGIGIAIFCFFSFRHELKKSHKEKDYRYLRFLWMMLSLALFLLTIPIIIYTEEEHIRSVSDVYETEPDIEVVYDTCGITSDSKNYSPCISKE